MQFINEPIKATVEPDGSRYVEVHNPLSRSVEEFHSDSPAPINITAKVSKVVADASVSTSSVDNALRARSGMPTKINGAEDLVQPQDNLEPVVPESTPITAPGDAQQSAEPTAPQADANHS